MKKVKEKITAMLNAITFAEMDEAETALSFMDPVVGHLENSLLNHDKDSGIPRSLSDSKMKSSINSDRIFYKTAAMARFVSVDS